MGRHLRLALAVVAAVAGPVSLRAEPLAMEELAAGVYLYIPAHFVQDIEVRYDGETILTVEGAISLSEDPSIHFSFVPEGPGEISVSVRDTEDRVFTGSWPVVPEAGS